MDSNSASITGGGGGYRGVRRRKWGKWVSEMRKPGTKSRVWLGSFASPEMAAVAHDVAALYLRGREARLNFPELADRLPRPRSSKPDDIRAAAHEALSRFFSSTGAFEMTGSTSNAVPTRVSLSPSEIQAINDSTMDSPVWHELAQNGSPFSSDMDYNELGQHDALWDI